MTIPTVAPSASAAPIVPTSLPNRIPRNDNECHHDYPFPDYQQNWYNEAVHDIDNSGSSWTRLENPLHAGMSMRELQDLAKKEGWVSIAFVNKSDPANPKTTVLKFNHESNTIEHADSEAGYSTLTDTHKLPDVWVQAAAVYCRFVDDRLAKAARDKLEKAEVMKIRLEQVAQIDKQIASLNAKISICRNGSEVPPESATRVIGNAEEAIKVLNEKRIELQTCDTADIHVRKQDSCEATTLIKKGEPTLAIKKKSWRSCLPDVFSRDPEGAAAASVNKPVTETAPNEAPVAADEASSPVSGLMQSDRIGDVSPDSEHTINRNQPEPVAYESLKTWKAMDGEEKAKPTMLADIKKTMTETFERFAEALDALFQRLADAWWQLFETKKPDANEVNPKNYDDPTEHVVPPVQRANMIEISGGDEGDEGDDANDLEDSRILMGKKPAPTLASTPPAPEPARL